MTWLYAEYTNYLTNRAGENDMDALENYNCCIELILTILTQQKCMSMMSQIIKQESGFLYSSKLNKWEGIKLERCR